MCIVTIVAETNYNHALTFCCANGLTRFMILEGISAGTRSHDQTPSESFMILIAWRESKI
jgi:hypothetical protein